jgi:protein-S-isoprenylcysteine O-methyltransferase Ste14
MPVDRFSPSASGCLLSMRSLELKIPPPVVALLAGLLMWLVSRIAPSMDAPILARFWFAPALAVVGVAFSASGAIAFSRAKTTANPMKPEAASSLVADGPYKISRNPMYVGLTLILVAWAIFLCSGWVLAGPLLFAVYIRRFQIAPEERALAALFGAEYSEYRTRVRRWL